MEALIRLHDKDYGTRGPKASWLEALRRSSVVLLSAILEAYLEDVVEESLVTLILLGHAAEEFPLGIRDQAWRRDIDRAGTSPTASKMEALRDRQALLWHTTRPPTLEELYWPEVRDGFMNPKTKEVNRLLGYMDMDRIQTSCRVNMGSGAADPTSILMRLVDTRNRVAHGDSVKIPISGVRELLKFVRKFCTQVDRRLAARMRLVTGSMPW